VFANNHSPSRCYSTGKGVSRDYRKAFGWYQLAAEQGNSVAQYEVARCYRRGQGVEKNSKLAVRWMRKSAKQGNRGAQVILADLYTNGEGVRRDLKQAAMWHRKAANQGEKKAQSKLVELMRMHPQIRRLSDNVDTNETLTTSCTKLETLSDFVHGAASWISSMLTSLSSVDSVVV